MHQFLLDIVHDWFSRFARCIALGGLLYLVCIGSEVHSQTIDWENWIGVPDPYFHDGLNWLGGAPPGIGNTARFDINQTYQVWWNAVTASSTPSIGFLQVRQGLVGFINQESSSQLQLVVNGSAGAGAFNDLSISGSATELTINGLHLHSEGGAQVIDGSKLIVDGSHVAGSKFSVAGTAGLQVDGSIEVKAGGIMDNFACSIGFDNGSNGHVTVSGIGSMWHTTDELTVGNDGNGTLQILDGALVQDRQCDIGFGLNSNGSVTVSCQGSRLENSDRMVVGYDSKGSLVIENGGKVTSKRSEIGLISTDSNNLVRVSGVGSEWTESALMRIGLAGSGNLVIEDGGLVTCNSSEISSHGTTISTITVTGAGSRWINVGQALIGQFGHVEMTVSNGGFVSGDRISIGVQNNQFGMATISGAGSELHSTRELTIGEFGSGSMVIEQGGVVRSLQGRVGFGSTTVATGHVVVRDEGSLWEMTTSLHVGGDGDGSLMIQSGGKVIDVDGYVDGKGLQFDTIATVTGNQSEWHNSGSLFVGRVGDGILNVENGGYVRNVNGTLGVFLAGQGELNVSGLGSHWESLGNVFVGGVSAEARGQGEINILEDGVVSVAGIMKIWDRGTVNLAAR